MRALPAFRRLSTRKGRAIRHVALLAAGLALSPVQAFANSTVIQLGFKENGYSSSGPVIYDNISAPTEVEGAATLVFEVAGNFEADGNYLEVLVDGTSIGTFFETGGPVNVCPPFGYTGTASSTQVTVSIPETVMRAAVQTDGLVDLKFRVKNTSGGTPGLACADQSNACFSVRVLSAVLTINEPVSAAEEKAITSSSLTKSRTAVTIANLPNLSNRLARVSFRSAPVAPRSPTPSAPTPSAPTPNAPTPSAPAPSLPGGSPQSGASLPGGGGSGGGVVISGGGNSNTGNFSFSGDFSSIRGAAAAKELARRAAFYGESRQAAAYRLRNGVGGAGVSEEQSAALSQAAGFDILPEEPAFDIWFGGSFSYFDTELAGVGQTGGVGSLQMGVDTRLNNDVLLGVAVFGDLLRSDSSTGSQSHGLGGDGRALCRDRRS